MAQTYEYKIITEPIAQVLGDSNMEHIAEWDGSRAERFLTPAFDSIANDLPQLMVDKEGGLDWEVCSHSIIFLGKALLVTILLRRPT